MKHIIERSLGVNAYSKSLFILLLYSVLCVATLDADVQIDKGSRLVGKDGVVYELSRANGDGMNSLGLTRVDSEGMHGESLFTFDVKRWKNAELVDVIIEGDDMGVLIREDITYQYGVLSEYGTSIVYLYAFYFASANPELTLSRSGYMPMPSGVVAETPYVLIAREFMLRPPFDNTKTEKWAWNVELQSPRKVVCKKQDKDADSLLLYEFSVDSITTNGEKGYRGGPFPGLRSDFEYFFNVNDAKQAIKMIVDEDFSGKSEWLPSFCNWVQNTMGGVDATLDFFRPYAMDEHQFAKFTENVHTALQENERLVAERNAQHLKAIEESRMRKEEELRNHLEKREALQRQLQQEKADRRKMLEERRRRREAEETE